MFRVNNMAPKDLTPKKKRKIRNELTSIERGKNQKGVKNFQSSWLDEPSFKGWLESLPNDATKCRCRACDKVLTAGKSELEKHAAGNKHRQNALGLSNTTNIEKSFQQGQKNVLTVDGVKKAELCLSSFFAKHNVALSLVENLVSVLQKTFKDSETCQKMTLCRRKCTALIKNVLKPVAVNEMLQEFENKFFSVLVDETTDVSNVKQMCVLVHYYDIDIGEVKTNLLEMLPLHVTSCTAENMFNEFKKCLEKHKLSMKYIVGMASDNANVMTGQTNSFFSRLRAENPMLFLMRCICHSSALISTHACAKLPRSPEDLIRQISTYISGSSNRCEQLSELQEAYKLAKKKMLKLCDTRWLCCYEVVVRVLEYYDVLKAYFKEAATTDLLKSAETIYEELNNDFNKAYLLFMKYVLKTFNDFSKLFQSDQVLIHTLSQASKDSLHELCGNYMLDGYSRRAEIVSVTDPKHFKKLEDISLGTDCEDFLQSLPAEETEQGRHNFRLQCLNFYIEGAKQMKARLPLTDSCFDEFRFFGPKHLFSLTSEKVAIPHLREKLKNYLAFDVNEAERELKKILTISSREEIQEYKTMKINIFWKNLKEKRNFLDEEMFPNVCAVATLLLSLPHSNAEAERIFSILKDVKSPKRNSLADGTLNSLLTYRSICRNVPAENITINKKHLKLFDSTMYEFNNNKRKK